MTGAAPTFATALNCMDGRVQLPVNEAVCSIFGVSYVDTITEAGIVRLLSDEIDSPQAKSALQRVQISLDKHGSRAIALAAHQDCAGNPCSDRTQQEQLRRAVAFLKGQFAVCTIVGLWIGNDWVARVAVPHPSV